MAAYISSKKGVVKLNFICTHNSRRSHLSQVWAHTAAAYYGFSDIACYSGGTEATAIYPSVISTFRNIGFRIEIMKEGANPLFHLFYSAQSAPLELFSKKFDDTFNPDSGFAAVMVCSDADLNCPYVPGKEVKFAMSFDDPKVSDGTTAEVVIYAERSFEIATQMAYIFKQVKR